MRLGRARVPVSLERERVPQAVPGRFRCREITRARVSEPVKLTPARMDDAGVARARGKPRTSVRVGPCAPPALQSHIAFVPVVLSCRRRFERGVDADASTSIAAFITKLRVPPYRCRERFIRSKSPEIPSANDVPETNRPRAKGGSRTQNFLGC